MMDWIRLEELLIAAGVRVWMMTVRISHLLKVERDD